MVRVSVLVSLVLPVVSMLLAVLAYFQQISPLHYAFIFFSLLIAAIWIYWIYLLVKNKDAIKYADDMSKQQGTIRHGLFP